MLFFAHHRTLFRAVALLTLSAMLPSSVQAWHFLPPPPPLLPDIDLDRLLDMKAIEAIAPGEAPYTLLAQAELQQRRTDLLAKNTPAPKTSFPGLEDSKKFFDTVTLGEFESLAAEMRRFKAAQVIVRRSDIPPSLGPAGGAEAAARLESAIQQYEAAAYVPAAIAFVEVMDRHPGSHEAGAANKYFLNIIKQYIAGHLGAQDIGQIEAALPQWDTLSPEGRYAYMDFYATGLEFAMVSDNREAMERFVAGTESWAKRLLEDNPDHPLVHSAALYLYDAALARDRIEVAEHSAHHEGDWDNDNLGSLAAYLRTTLAGQGPGMARFSAWDILAQIASGRNGEDGTRLQARLAMVQEAGEHYLQEVLDDPNCAYWVKGRIVYALSVALNDIGRPGAALAWLDWGLEHSVRKSGPTYELMAYERARTIHQQDRFSEAGGSGALWDFVRAYPDSPHTPVALQLLGDIYMSAGDYDGASTIYSQIATTYPESDYALGARQNLEYLGRNLLGTMPALAEAPARAPAPVAQWCGPLALQALLAALKIDAPVRELASLAGADTDGTTMAGLQRAAQEKGLSLTGIQAQTIDEVPLPAIAYVDGNHFLTVTEAGPETVTVLDNGEPARRLTRFDFGARWSGEALIVTPARPLARVLADADLAARKGGTQTYPNTGGSESTGGGNNGGDTPTGPACGDLAGDPGSPPSYTAIRSSGVNLTIQSFKMAPMLHETDVAMPVQSGDVPLSFQRYYTLEKYNARQYNTVAAYPWQNNIGASWSHNYNMYIHNSNPQSSHRDLDKGPTYALHSPCKTTAAQPQGGEYEHEVGPFKV